MISSRTLVLSVLAAVVGSVLLTEGGIHMHKFNPHEGEATWSIQGKDDAMAGCPNRYKEWVDLPDGGAVLLGCWGDSNL